MNFSELPFLTRNTPGIGGAIETGPESFDVEEIPLYQPCGEGEHLYLWIEKRGVSTPELLTWLSRQFGVHPADFGTAGLKDKHAVTRQHVSMPFREGVAAGEWPDAGVSILRVERHGNKLRRGHLRGNRFKLRVRPSGALDLDQAEVKAREILDRLANEGLPNYYGEQRFGRGDSTFELGVAILRGDRSSGARIARNKSLRRLAVNSVQSRGFNEVLAERIRRGCFRTVLEGDVMRKLDSGGQFVVSSGDAPEAISKSQLRLESREIVPTGPMDGPKMVRPEGSAAELEDSVFTRIGIPRISRDFTKIAPGERRGLIVYPGDVSLKADPRTGVLEIAFSLPAGSYATVLLREIVKSDG